LLWLTLAICTTSWARLFVALLAACLCPNVSMLLIFLSVLVWPTITPHRHRLTRVRSSHYWWWLASGCYKLQESCRGTSVSYTHSSEHILCSLADMPSHAC
jgi:hypothetical protein